MLPELLCPAGSFDALKAAVLAGADAVYIGGDAFNARLNAHNFSDSEIVEAAEFCHQNGVKLHVAVNTQVLDREMQEAVNYIGKLYVAGVDAIICADLGLAREIHRLFPDLELHASTQCSGHNSDAAKLFANMGFSRMVAAREMSSIAIKELCDASPIDIEIFVHGAICVCHSGQCLMSQAIGGRSGNRGLCAQPCRMPYNNSYPLSIKDMCLAKRIPEILKLGVCSLKVEGRMKSPEYVYGVTRIYRRLLDERRSATDAEIKELSELFSRNGFTDGYFMGNINKSMNGVRTEENKQATRRVHQSFKKLCQRESLKAEKRTLPTDLTISDYTKEKAQKSSSARFYFAEAIPKKHPFDIVYLPLEKYDGTLANGVMMPPVIYEKDRESVLASLQRAKDEGAMHLLISNIGQIEMVRELGFTLHGDFRLNVFNSLTGDFLLKQGLCDVILSPELTLAQIRDIILQKSVIIYGRQPLMLLEKTLEARELRDRRNARFPIIREGGRDILLNSQITYMLDREKDLKKAFINNRHFIFTTKSVGQVEKVLADYEKGTPRDNGIRRIK